MTQQYFARDPLSESHPRAFSFDYRGHTLQMTTDHGVFSYGELDEGSRILLNALPELSGRVLDLGCGCGVIGIAAGKACDVSLVLSDVNERALGLARDNLRANGVCGETVESDGFAQIDGLFDWILCNPPIRAGKEVIYRLFRDAARHLSGQGQLWLVIRRQQGAESALRYLRTLYQSAEVTDRSKGYWVICCSQTDGKGADGNDV